MSDSDNRVTVHHNFSQYNTPPNTLQRCFYKINPKFAFFIDVENDTIQWWGIAERIAEFPFLFFTQVDIPSVDDVNAVKPSVEQDILNKQNRAQTVNNRITTRDKSFTFVTCPNGNACVTILPGSNSVASNLDGTKRENLTSVPSNTYTSLVQNLPIHTYNIIGQDVNKLHIGPNSDDWNNVFNFESKDPAKQNVELMDIIGVMLTCIKDLSARVSALESN